MHFGVGAGKSVSALLQRLSAALEECRPLHNLVKGLEQELKEARNAAKL